ncbi:MAG: hypothetical protein KDD60_00465 [Bdellovibrionales bacterium]|nr:hypothetical protein [Bdellovibrionales bacterium]
MEQKGTKLRCMGLVKKGEAGITLLEYAAGAAFVLATAAIVMIALRGGMENAFAGIGTWLEGRVNALDARDPDTN